MSRKEIGILSRFHMKRSIYDSADSILLLKLRNDLSQLLNDSGRNNLHYETLAPDSMLLFISIDDDKQAMAKASCFLLDKNYTILPKNRFIYFYTFPDLYLKFTVRNKKEMNKS